MNCETATKVYSSTFPLLTIEELFPLAWQFLIIQSNNFVEKRTNSFDRKVHELVGSKDFAYLTTHRENEDELSKELQELIGDLTSKLLLEDYFSKLVNKKLYFGLLCCD